MLNDAPLSRLIFIAGLSVGVVACQNVATEANKSEEEAQQSAGGASVAKVGDSSDARRGDSSPKLRALSIDQIAGGWRVVSSSRGGSVMNGAIAEIYPQSVTWSFRPAGMEQPNQLCREPVLEGLSAERPKASTEKVLKELTGPLKVTALSGPHEVRCASGGDWGPEAGANLALTDTGQLVMSWGDGETLLLDKLKRPSAPEALDPSDYKADSAH